MFFNVIKQILYLNMNYVKQGDVPLPYIFN